ncbi:MAG: SBBP repeat-containing protein, partial [bacterium]
MRNWLCLQAAIALFALLLAEPAAVCEQPPSLPPAPPPATQKLSGNYARLPLSFEENRGQTDPEVKFLSRGPGYTLFLTADEAVLRLKGAEQPAVLRLRLVDANPAPKVTGLDPLPGKSNYLLGNDPAKWRTNVPHYARVRFENIYPGIDLVYYGTEQGQLEYDFIVHPGADLAAIRLNVDGADHLRISDDGDLIVFLPSGELRLRQPLVYQDTDAGRTHIPGGYVLRGKRRVSFQVAAYDTSRPLILDPVLVYSTYLGGFNDDRGHDIAADGAGNSFVTGVTVSPNFPTQNALQPTPGTMSDSGDAFVTKLNAAGSMLVYSTYLGGSNLDQARSIHVDSSGNAYIAGFSASSDFPTTSGAFDTSLNNDEGTSDVFMAKLNADGSALLYSTYLGGSGPEEADSIAVDLSGNAYVTGGTASFDFPVTPGAFNTTPGQESFVARLNATGSALVYSTYLGGSGLDFTNGIAVDGAGNAYVTGVTSSTDFPTTPGAFDQTCGTDGLCNGNFNQGDAFVTKLNATGSALVYSTYLGGSGAEEAADIAVDSFGAAYITGITTSLDFPTAAALQPTCANCQIEFDAFLTKLNPAGFVLEYSTYLGGNGQDWVQAIALDAQRNAYLTGATNSTDFPMANAIQASLGGSFDQFITRVSRKGSVVAFSTYLG